MILAIAMMTSFSHQQYHECYKCTAELSGGNCYANDNSAKKCSYCVLQHVVQGKKFSDPSLELASSLSSE